MNPQAWVCFGPVPLHFDGPRVQDRTRKRARQTTTPDRPGGGPWPGASTQGQSEDTSIHHGVATPRTFPIKGIPHLCPKKISQGHATLKSPLVDKFSRAVPRAAAIECAQWARGSSARSQPGRRAQRRSGPGPLSTGVQAGAPQIALLSGATRGGPSDGVEPALVRAMRSTGCDCRSRAINTTGCRAPESTLPSTIPSSTGWCCR